MNDHKSPKDIERKILVIVGPTASGKTALSIKIAEKLNGEIVSADSRQIYRGMDIGTAKPARDSLKYENENRKEYLSSQVIHHLIDIKNPNQDYTVADYKRDAIRAIKKILSKGKVPILVGGTGLYVKAVVENLNIPKVKANHELRKKLEDDLSSKGLDFLFKKLVSLDPEAIYIVDQHNPRRVIRALEVALRTGRPFTAERKKGKALFDPTIIAITQPAEIMRKRIEERVDEMIRDGLVKEVRGLYEKYGKVRALEAIGYREIIEYVEEKISFGEAIRKIKMNTWHYAKRQMTWFKKDKKIIWVDQKTKTVQDILHLMKRDNVKDGPC